MKRNLLLILLLLCCLALTGCSQKGTTGNEWLLQQKSYCEELQEICSSIDDVYSLYLLGSMEINDYCNEIQLLQVQALACSAQYEQQKKDANILPASHSYASKAGVDALESSNMEIQMFLEQSLETTDRETLARLYVDFQDEMITNLATYITSYNLIQAEKEGSKNE